MLLIAAAVAASIVALALLVSILRAVGDAGRFEAHPPERRAARSRPRDPREALALVGNALAATHNPRALLPLILEVVTEATGAKGGQLLQNGVEIGWIGDVGRGPAPLVLDLTAGDDSVATELRLYPSRRGFRGDTRKLAEWLAAQASIALENARLHEQVQRQATTDELTNLDNRRRFIDALEAEVERARLLDAPLSVVLADIDDFKRVNDRYGHHGGDRALRVFADLLRAHLREGDVAGRIGGEEFAILLPDTTAAAAGVVAQRTLATVRAARVVVGQESIRLTASFGVAQHVPGAAADKVLLAADEALYRAKGDGKNCVRSAASAEVAAVDDGSRLA
jgi:diguanylate cyclase (GGDEF)-like protein